MMENEIALINEETTPYVSVRSATKLMILGDTSGITTYVYGIAGTGKTRLVQNFLGKRKYYELDAATMTEESLILRPITDKRKIVVIDNLHDIPLEHADSFIQRIYELAAREDIWLILISRSPVPPWLLGVQMKYEINIIEESRMLLQENM